MPRLVRAVGEDLDAQVRDAGTLSITIIPRLWSRAGADHPRRFQEVGHDVVRIARCARDYRERRRGGPTTGGAPASTSRQRSPTMKLRESRCRVPRGLEEQPGLGLAARAVVGVVVVARHTASSGSALQQAALIASTSSRAAAPARDVGLVGDHDEPEAAGGEQGHRLGHAGQDLELVDGARRTRRTVPTVVPLSTPSRSRKAALSAPIPTSSRWPCSVGWETKQVPDHRLERLRVRRDRCRADRRHDHAGVGHLRRCSRRRGPTMPQILAPDLLRVLHRAHEVGADVALEVAAADREDEASVRRRRAGCPRATPRTRSPSRRR